MCMQRGAYRLRCSPTDAAVARGDDVGGGDGGGDGIGDDGGDGIGDGGGDGMLLAMVICLCSCCQLLELASLACFASAMHFAI